MNPLDLGVDPVGPFVEFSRAVYRLRACAMIIDPSPPSPLSKKFNRMLAQREASESPRSRRRPLLDENSTSGRASGSCSVDVTKPSAALPASSSVQSSSNKSSSQRWKNAPSLRKERGRFSRLMCTASSEKGSEERESESRHRRQDSGTASITLSSAAPAEEQALVQEALPPPHTVAKILTRREIDSQEREALESSSTKSRASSRRLGRFAFIDERETSQQLSSYHDEWVPPEAVKRHAEDDLWYVFVPNQYEYDESSECSSEEDEMQTESVASRTSSRRSTGECYEV